MRSSDFDTLVDRTSGLQPWRKAFHAINGTIIATTVVLLEPTRQLAVLIAGLIALLLLSMDLYRLTRPKANKLFFQLFHRLASPRDARTLASSTWYAAGILISVSAFPLTDVVSGVLVLAFADPAAAIVGRKLGKRPFLGGTLEGSAAFFATSLVVLTLRHTWPLAVLVSVLTTLVERRSWPLDDNFTIPVVSAGTLVGLGMIL